MQIGIIAEFREEGFEPMYRAAFALAANPVTEKDKILKICGGEGNPLARRWLDTSNPVQAVQVKYEAISSEHLEELIGDLAKCLTPGDVVAMHVEDETVSYDWAYSVT